MHQLTASTVELFPFTPADDHHATEINMHLLNSTPAWLWAPQTWCSTHQHNRACIHVQRIVSAAVSFHFSRWSCWSFTINYTNHKYEHILMQLIAGWWSGLIMVSRQMKINYWDTMVSVDSSWLGVQEYTSYSLQLQNSLRTSFVSSSFDVCAYDDDDDDAWISFLGHCGVYARGVYARGVYPLFCA